MKLMFSTLLVALVLSMLTGCNPPAPPPIAPMPEVTLPPVVQALPPKEHRPARTLIESSPVDLDQEASFAEFSRRFAQARQNQTTLPCGQPELARLYQLVVAPGFQGAADTEEVKQKLQEWASANADDPTPRIALVRVAIAEAKLASETERFETILREAHNAALEIAKDGAKDPEVYRLVLATGYELHLPAAELAPWMEAGPRQFPNYYPLYDSIAKIVGERQTGQLPDMVRLANQASESQSDNDWLEVYARVALAASRVDPRALVHSGFDLERLNAGARFLLERHPEAAQLVDFIGVVAYLTEDFDLGNEVLPELKSKPLDRQQWGNGFLFDQFQQRLKLPMPKEKPQRQMWASPEGGSSLVFIDEGRHLAMTPYQGQTSLTVWPLHDASLPPYLVQTGKRIGAQLDADRAGKRLMSYSITQRAMVASSFDLSQGTIPENMTHVRSFKPSFEIVEEDPETTRNGRWSLGFFEISADGTRAVASSRGEVEVFDPGTGESINRFTAADMHKFEKFGRQLSSDGRLLALQGEKGFEVWDCDQGTKLFAVNEQTIKTHYILSPLNVQPNRNLLLHVIERTSGAGEITLANWNPDLQELKHLGPLGRRLTPIAALGNELVACASLGALGTNQELAIYRVSDGKCLRTIQGHVGTVLYARFSPDGQWIAAMDRLGPAKLWKIPQD